MNASPIFRPILAPCWSPQSPEGKTWLSCQVLHNGQHLIANVVRLTFDDASSALWEKKAAFCDWKFHQLQPQQSQDKNQNSDLKYGERIRADGTAEMRLR